MAALALSLTTTAGSTSIGMTHASAAQQTRQAQPFRRKAAPHVSTLPNGDRVLVTGSGPDA